MSEAWVPFFKLVPLQSRNWVALLTSWYHLAAVCWALQQVRRLGQTICLEFELNAQTQPSFIYTPRVALVHPLNGIFYCWLLYCQNSGSCWDADLKPSVIGIYPPTHVYCWTVYRWVVLCPWAGELVGTALHVQLLGGWDPPMWAATLPVCWCTVPLIAFILLPNPFCVCNFPFHAFTSVV